MRKGIEGLAALAQEVAGSSGRSRLLFRPSRCALFPEVPFADERNRYLHHCATLGARPEVLRVKRNELLWIARHLGPEAAAGVGMAELLPIAQARQNLQGAATAARRVIDIGRPWLKFLGW
ncbi:hypothetical protein [Sinorhizobium sp. BJ1]|uniref:hypothetical protein n=1 Tax=Sinorhizobium sp. BJ1 TaxID=2035455 RepID=UPI001FE00E19|nr:hypothetical protein [Sinorhizobium sp. BJ1]